MLLVPGWFYCKCCWSLADFIANVAGPQLTLLQMLLVSGWCYCKCCWFQTDFIVNVAGPLLILLQMLLVSSWCNFSVQTFSYHSLFESMFMYCIKTSHFNITCRSKLVATVGGYKLKLQNSEKELVKWIYKCLSSMRREIIWYNWRPL